MIRKKSCERFLLNIPILVCILTALFSPIMVYQYSTFFSALLLLVWIATAFFNKGKWTLNEICTIFFYGYLIIIPHITGNGFVSNRYLVLAVFILGSLIAGYCEYTNLWENIGNILKGVTPFLVYVYLKTFLALLNNPYASRKIKTTGEYTILARAQGVGGYEFIYFLAMLTSICCGMFFLIKNKKQKWLWLFVGALSYMEVVLSNYMTALLIATAGVVLTIMLLLIKRNRAWLGFFVLCIVFLIVFGNGIMKLGLEAFIYVIPQNGKTFQRLYNMKDAFFQSLIKEFLSDRIDTMIRSLKCLFKYPLLGIVGESGLDREAILSEVGQHSYFMDTFAFYGCLVGFFAIINYFFLFKKTYFKGNFKVITVPVIICGFILLLVNNLTISIGVIICIVYPYALYLLKKQEMEDEK